MPNIKEIFSQELKKGTGKAVLLFRRYHKKHNLVPLVVNASIHNPDYDPQCSGSRDVYLYEMLRELPDREKIA